MITQIFDTIENTLSDFSKPFVEFLDANPEAYKAYVIAMHIFRAASMFALMEISPMPLLTVLGMGGLSYLYFAGIENRACVFKFTLLSSFGGMALWMTKASAIALFSAPAFGVIGLVAGLASLAVYTITVVQISFRDVENYLKRNINPETPKVFQCCKQ